MAMQWSINSKVASDFFQEIARVTAGGSLMRAGASSLRQVSVTRAILGAITILASSGAIVL